MVLSITDKRRVAIAYDGSEDARKLFDWSVKNIIRPDSDHIILLSAVHRVEKTGNVFNATARRLSGGKEVTNNDLPMLSTTVTKVDEAIKEAETQHPQVSHTARQRLESTLR